MTHLGITEVAQRSGVPASASPGRAGRTAGVTPDRVALMFAPDGRPRADRKRLVAKAYELGNTIRELSAMRD